MEDLLPAPLLAQGFPAGEAAGGNGRFANRPYRGGALRCQQAADGVLDRLALRRLPQPLAQLAAGDGDGDAVAFLAELGEALGGCRRRRLGPPGRPRRAGRSRGRTRGGGQSISVVSSLEDCAYGLYTPVTEHCKELREGCQVL